MQSLYSYLGSSDNLWRAYRFNPSYTRLHVSEVWQSVTAIQQGVPNGCTVVHRVIDGHELKDELYSCSSQSIPHHDSECRLRIAWITTNVKERCYDISSKVFNQVVDLFDHHEARKSYASSVAGFTQLPTTPAGLHPGFLCVHPKLAMTWSRRELNEPTNIICMADPQKIQDIKDMLYQPFLHHALQHRLVPLLMGAVLCSLEVDRDKDTVKHAVRQIESRTGHHGFNSRIEGPAGGDLFHLSASMSGYKTKIASCVRKLDVLTAINDYILTESDNCHADDLTAFDVVDKVSKELRSYVLTLMERTRMQRIDTDFIQSRVQTQLEALFHLITETDAIAGHEVAKDSRLLALAAQRDSSSMKSLAVVTMFFLPGTFVSSLFSMPLFDWDGSNNLSTSPPPSWRSRLGLYFAVTGPLMFLTFAVWGLWVFVDTLKTRNQNRIAQQQLADGMQMPENRILARRWTSASMEIVASKSEKQA